MKIKIDKAEERLKILLDLTHALVAESSLELWFQKLTECTQQVVPTAGWFVYFFNEDKSLAYCRLVTQGHPAAQIPDVPPPLPVRGEKILESLLRDKKPLFAPSISPMVDDNRALADRYQVTSAVLIPLVYQGDVFGFFGCGSYRDEKPLEVTAPQLEFLGSVAETAAVCLRSLLIQEQLRSSEEQLRSFFDGARDVIVFIDANRIIRKVSSRSLKQVLGYDPEEVIGRSVQTFYAFEEDFIRYSKKYFSVGSKMPEEPYECRYRRKNGETIWAEILPSIVHNAEGHTMGWLSIIRDATQRKRAEEESKKLQAQFHQSQKMDALGRLTGGVAHDFNNLLTAMIGHLELVKMKVKPDNPILSHVDEISRAADRASKLTRQLLTFTRSQVVVPKVLHINMIVEESQKLLSRLIQENIEIVTELKPDASRVKVDVGQIEQVIVNLAVNAQDAMPNGGKLVISTREMELRKPRRIMEMELLPGRYVVLTVKDTGTGMPKEVMQHLFEPFFTTKEQGKGTGLGLATVYGIIKQFDGAIEVESAPGKGSAFSIYLPTVDAHTELADLHDNVAPERGHETVFLVEDDAVIRNLNQEILQSMGYRVLVASNGVEALEVARKHRGDVELLIIDVILPKMDGYQTALRLSEILPKMKVLYVSGYTKDVTLEHGIKEPGLNFMQKPFTPDQFLNRVREVLDAGKAPARS